MAQRPIFLATHPRACSTAFERVFMTCHDSLVCIHEPFGDAFYFGPERLSERYEQNEQARVDSGFDNSTYRTIIDRIEKDGTQGKRVFIKDILHYIVPPNGAPPSVAPSLARTGREVEINGDTGDRIRPSRTTNGVQMTTSHRRHDSKMRPSNPTVIPEEILKKFHFTFLIRHPRHSIPSYYRCTVPPLEKVTGFSNFVPSEAGYDELRRVFDYLRDTEQIGPQVAGQHDSTSGSRTTNGSRAGVEICVVDADDLLDNPNGITKSYCKSVGLEYDENMLNWNLQDCEYAARAFEKWKGFHEDAIHSYSLKARTNKKKVRSPEEDYAEWVQKYGKEGATVIRDTVEANTADYGYLKQFAIKAS